MFLLTPLIIFLTSIAIIVLVITRKFVFLKKITPEAVQPTNGGKHNFIDEMFPEFMPRLRSVNLRSYSVNLLAESEKFLRKARLIFMRIDALTNSLIHKVRSSSKKQEAIIIQAETKKEEEMKVIIENVVVSRSNELKTKEQGLIIEIAKSPKDINLYRQLGDLYMETGELTDAKQSFEKILELNLEDSDAKLKLIRIEDKLEKILSK